jgi:hypothetical protein
MAIPRAEAIHPGPPLVAIAALPLAWRSEVLRSFLESLPNHAQALAAAPVALAVLGIVASPWFRSSQDERDGG